KRTRIGEIVTLAIALITACRKPYAPPIITSSGGGTGYLVVEGVINAHDSTVIRLSRTVPLSSKSATKPELGASVSVISDGGSSYALLAMSGGYYSAPSLNLSETGKYGLKITTADGKVYQSDLVTVKDSPPIDSVYYRVKSNGLQIYADTHDPANNTRYYRWDYNETYEYHSAFYSFEYLSTSPVDTVLVRNPANQIYYCWRSNHSPDIIINSSAKLSNDIISQNPVTFIPSNSEKIGVRYSILVKQYALTPDAFNYYQQLQKNTERLGTIFDPQPSELPGNIHCVTTPSEPVVGYITAGAPAQARIFIDARDLPAWTYDSPYSGCRLDTDLFKRVEGSNEVVNEVQLYIYTGVHIPVYAIEPPGSNQIQGYASSDPDCVDCTLRGTNVRPGFWVGF
ncbi:MAG: DUF4249 domain-containing protein, partial [Bacteroidetes bacterium]|nr:DUF4249 domain-containing protein [Bacteroidota bacterium]